MGLLRPEDSMRICIIQPGPAAVSETFLLAQAQGLPGTVTVVHGTPPAIGTRPVLSQSLVHRAARKARRVFARQGWEREVERAYVHAIQTSQADVVLAQYGPTGVCVMPACREAGVPLVVHFHGYDASKTSVLMEHRVTYQQMFRQAAVIIAVSHAMRQRLIDLGAQSEKVFYNPYGVDCRHFVNASHGESPATFLGVGRLVEKKAPHMTLLAFAKAREECPQVRLRLIGDGPLAGVLTDLAKGLGIEDSVDFLGAQPQATVQAEMRRARAFVQHSVEAANGDCEGTPVAILEAGASGLPVIATRHAGIPDAVLEGETGFLVDERDVGGMAAHMVALANDPALAARLGAAAARRIADEFNLEGRLSRLAAILGSCVGGPRPELVPEPRKPLPCGC